MKLVRAKEGYRKVGDKWLIAKKCTCCGKWLVASTVNFHREKGGRYGVRSECKECKNKKHKQWCEANPEYDKQYRKNNKEKIVERKKQWYQANKEKRAEYHKQWRKDNPKYNKQYYKANKEERAKYRKRYYETNKEKELEQHKQYDRSPQGQVVAFNSHQRRRIKEEQQGTGITKDQWLELMNFFDWKCAYSGETLSKDTRSIDHIVPLDAGGDNMIWNVVPMLRSLNCSKKDKDMLEWYREQSFYNPKRLAKIYEWQEFAYNKWGKDSEYFNTNNIQIKLI